MMVLHELKNYKLVCNSTSVSLIRMANKRVIRCTAMLFQLHACTIQFSNNSFNSDSAYSQYILNFSVCLASAIFSVIIRNFLYDYVIIV